MKTYKTKGWLGQWVSPKGTLGWMGLRYIGPYASSAEHPDIDNPNFRDDDVLYLAEITVRPLLDKLGRPITRKVGRLRAQRRAS